MKLHCPHCGVAGSVDNSYSGRKVKCPKCRAIFVLSSALSGEVPNDAPTVAFSSSITLHCPHCGVAGSAESSYRGRNVQCPKCRRQFPLAANLSYMASADPSPLVSTTPTAVEGIAAGEDAATEPVFAEPAVSTVDETIIRKPHEGAMPGEPRDHASVSSTVLAYKLPGYGAVAGDMNTEKTATVVSKDDLVRGEGQGRDERNEIFAEKAAAREEAQQEVMPEITEAELLSVKAEPLETGEPGNDAEEIATEAETIEQEPYGIHAEQCWQCGKQQDNAGQPFTSKAGRLYCHDCMTKAKMADTTAATAGTESFARSGGKPENNVASGSPDLPFYDFSIGEALREAWDKTRGAKGTIWKGSSIMYLAILVVVAIGAFFLPSQTPGYPEDSGMVGGTILQAATDLLSVLFTAGLLYMGIRRASGDPIEWRMVSRGFSCAGKVIVASILQTVLVGVGILALVLPGIYLAVGYTMVLPLIVDQGMSPWQAMETSRKAIHKIWWKMAGLLFVMGMILLVSMIPLGIGLIWTWPMFIILAGVVYRYLFRSAKKAD